MLTDFKSRLQEYLQAQKRGNIIYKVIAEEGLPNDRTFTVEVLLKEDNDEIRLGVGQGKSKKEAEENAAKEALKKKAS